MELPAPGCILPIALMVAMIAPAPGSAVSFTGGAAGGPQAAAAGTPVFNGVVSVTDGAGGAIFVWSDLRLPADENLYAGRIGADGALRWPGNSMPVCTVSGGQRLPQVASDGLGGAFIVWIDARAGGTTDIYVQHIDSNGVAQWGSGGVPACTAAGNQENPAMILDGAGGVIVAWEDWRSGVDIYAQRIDASGARLWAVNGVPIGAASGSQYEPGLVPDGSRGAIVSWSDFRSGGDVYAQRVDSTGTSQWTANGVAVVATPDIENFGAIFADGSGGAIVTCTDFTNATIRIQRLDANGVGQWAAGGVSPCSVAYSASSLQVAPDAVGGMLLVWADVSRGGVYGQDVGFDGSLGWGPAGQLLPGVGGYGFAIQSDGAGGLFVGSQHDVDGLNGFAKAGIQRVNASGTVQWGASGIELPVTASWDGVPSPIADGAGGAIFSWGDHNRTCGMHPPCSISNTINEYASRFDGAGALVWASIALTSTGALGVAPGSPTDLRLAVDGPSPSVGGAKLRFELPSRANVRLALYDLAGRLVARLVDGELAAGEHTVTWSATVPGRSAGAGVFFARMQVGTSRVVQRVVVLE